VSTALVPAPTQVVAHFQRHTRLSVRQRKRWLEILLSFEARNNYDVFDEDKMPVLRVEEQGNGFLAFLKRIFLGPIRPFTAHVVDLASQGVLMAVRRPFRFFFHRVDVSGANGEPIGSIQRRWSWLRRIYTVYDAQGQEVATLFGPILRPWTFEVHLPGEKVEMGLIQKRWSGLLKEMFTDADNFWVELDRIQDPSLRALLFCATVLIDVVHFERAKS